MIDFTSPRAIQTRLDEALRQLGIVSARLGATEFALREIVANADSGEWTLPTSFANAARTALSRPHPPAIQEGVLK